LQIRIFVGLFVGATIAYVDNFLFQGEVSPIVIVILLLVAAVSIGITWKWRAVIAIALMWLWLPMAHVAKKVLGLPDTLHPNTYTSILLYAIFTFVISAIGFLLGLFARKIVKSAR
jgi:hypothetical protein